MRIEYSEGTYYSEPGLLHRWFAYDADGEQVGELYVDIDREIIMNIEVVPERRGEGIARALYQAADAALADLKHAPEIACTPEGLAFAQAMGGAVADDMDEITYTPESE